MRWALARILADALFPPRCAACDGFLSPGRGAVEEAVAGDQGTDIGDLFDGLMGGMLCDPCRAAFEPVRSPLCPCCGIMFPSRQGEDHLCGQCATAGHWFSTSRAVGRYQGPLRDMIHHLKYGGRVRLARPLGLLMYAVFRKTWAPGDIDMVMPVPLHRRRFRRRGFNQAWLLLRHWPFFSDTGEGRPEGLHFLRAGLVRRRATRPQTGLGRQERLSNLEGAFALAPGAAIDGRSVLLVDDVMTTGTTVDECARALLAAGAGRVDVLTLARAMT